MRRVGKVRSEYREKKQVGKACFFSLYPAK
ncbi:hypothetical protein HMPREF0987_01980 [Lachnospiraceae bacterium 9_1_43BFAA]|nr:hypothetical protein HMPREF0987_01980 [Lachnospiraceae bacterium 9_1_43BFAA]EPD62674.1 hypothetical protein HMPREF1216_01956 [Coprococcus sp. HPP0048]